jgi:arylsulfatase A-like enzyme
VYWKALLSVDDAIAGVAETLEQLKLWGSTYFFVTSDHGYNLGQHNLPSCKLNVYDHSIRIPMMIRGPGITPRQAFAEIGSNVDVAPTLLALAGIDPATTVPPMDGKSLLPWLLTGESALPALTAAQLATERARLGMAAGALVPAKPVREAHWVEFYSLGNLMMCGGDKCKADNDRPPYDPTGNGALEGMRCGAGTKGGHQVDSTTSNTYRAYRFVSEARNMLYAEFTAVTDWNFTAPDIFVEVFDVSKDPGQLHNLANVTSVADHAIYHAMLEKQFRCSGAACT